MFSVKALCSPIHSFTLVSGILEWVQFQDNLINGSVPDEICDLRNKNLFPGDLGKEVLKADCSPDNVTNAPFIFCASGCCNVCCDHTTGQCTNIEI
jgi:hypothetical protein